MTPAVKENSDLIFIGFCNSSSKIYICEKMLVGFEIDAADKDMEKKSRVVQHNHDMIKKYTLNFTFLVYNSSDNSSYKFTDIIKYYRA